MDQACIAGKDRSDVTHEKLLERLKSAKQGDCELSETVLLALGFTIKEGMWNTPEGQMVLEYLPNPTVSAQSVIDLLPRGIGLRWVGPYAGDIYECRLYAATGETQKKFAVGEMPALNDIVGPVYGYTFALAGSSALVILKQRSS